MKVRDSSWGLSVKVESLLHTKHTGNILVVDQWRKGTYFQKPQPFDIGRVWYANDIYKNKWQDCYHLVKERQTYNAQFEETRSKLCQLNFDSAVTIWCVVMWYILRKTVTIILNHWQYISYQLNRNY